MPILLLKLLELYYIVTEAKNWYFPIPIRFSVRLMDRNQQGSFDNSKNYSIPKNQFSSTAKPELFYKHTI